MRMAGEGEGELDEDSRERSMSHRNIRAFVGVVIVNS
jgi:hypothetical protein